MTASKKIGTAAVLGSTGSVGTQALTALAAAEIPVVLLTGGKNLTLLEQQVRQFRPALVAVPDAADGAALRALVADLPVKVYSGETAVCSAIADCGADLIVHAISGLAGLPAALTAAQTGARLAMANKEAIIAAGHLIYEKLAASGGELIPVDSEHSAIFQCLCAQGAARAGEPADSSRVRRILLTASGGPFFGWSPDQLTAVTPERALQHPTWKMGQKITIDSATLMNKGFELIEACRLFHVDSDRVEVVIHPQSIIHSMVEYIDTAVIAELSYPDMADCVRYAIHYPDRGYFAGRSLDFAALGTLTFHKPDYDAFPLLRTASEVWKLGGSAPATLIAADEEAVAAFLDGRIRFTEIAQVVNETLARMPVFPVDDVAAVYEAETMARACARELV